MLQCPRSGMDNTHTRVRASWGRVKTSSYSIIHSTEYCPRWVTQTPLSQFPQEVIGFWREQAQRLVGTQRNSPLQMVGSGNASQGSNTGVILKGTDVPGSIKGGGGRYPDRGKCMCKGTEVGKGQELGFLKTWTHTRKPAGGVTPCLTTMQETTHKGIQGGRASLGMKSKTELLILLCPTLPHLSQWQLHSPSFSSQNHCSHFLHPTLNE